eukprot:c5164_g1_i1.p1 GENE.c5164_g1_i1~~c5164_g1_i1.p1  ORF type:complete len:198 (-),score=24.62 c5164_g1_i1:193-786(-)
MGEEQTNTPHNKPQEMDLINSMPTNELEPLFFQCCGSQGFVEGLVQQRPFASFDVMTKSADDVWTGLTEIEWLKAFADHPRIGDRRRASGHKWAAGEQKAAETVEQAVTQELERLNTQYEQRHGFVFLICATGKSAPEILASLKARIENDTQTELKIAVEEQRKITLLRLTKLVQTFKPVQQDQRCPTFSLPCLTST